MLNRIVHQCEKKGRSFYFIPNHCGNLFDSFVVIVAHAITISVRKPFKITGASARDKSSMKYVKGVGEQNLFPTCQDPDIRLVLGTWRVQTTFFLPPVAPPSLSVPT